jgi:hypothetical protein
MRIQRYTAILDTLREQRRSPTWKAQDDRSLLAELDDLYREMSSEERWEAEEEGYRSWPDLYDERTARAENTE